jgi:hypothetical protein
MTANLTALGAEQALRGALIAGHASCAAIAFLLGLVLALRPSTRSAYSWAYGWAYAIALMLMTLLVTGAVILDWNGLHPAIRGLFAALIALAGYTAWRGWRARAGFGAVAPGLPAAGPGLARALDDLGFTLITLFTGFVLILANHLGGPIWLMVVLGVVCVAAGSALLGHVKARRLAHQAEGDHGDHGDDGGAHTGHDRERLGEGVRGGRHQ